MLNPATKGVGYVETDTPKKCGTCVFLIKGNLCNNKEVRADKQMRTDAKTQLKIVSAEDGCCNEWKEPQKAEEEGQEDQLSSKGVKQGPVQDGVNGLKYQMTLIHSPSKGAQNPGKPSKEGVSP